MSFELYQQAWDSRLYYLKSTLHSTANFLILSTLFAIAYAQSPLYTSNQNQYFLHGSAAAGIGNLDEDWLANTKDPTPVFSKLVELSLKYTKQEILFYIYYALLMGVYLSSLYAIADLLFEIRSSKLKSLIFITLFIAIHSGGFRFALSQMLDSDWAYVFEAGVADQRMLGPVFQPSSFAVFLMLSLYLFLSSRPYLAAASAAVAGVFHPTYLLSAALLILSFGIADWIANRKLAEPIRYGTLAMLLVAPVVIYVVSSFAGSSVGTATQARNILVNYRIPHHALVSEWFDIPAIFQVSLIVAALVLIAQVKTDPSRDSLRRTMLIILSSTSLTALLLTLAQILTANNALALLFPWRISILLVPFSTTVLLAYVTTRLVQALSKRSASQQRLAILACMLVLFLSVLLGAIRFFLEVQRKETAPERDLEAFVYAQVNSGEIYLIPDKMQDFRLEAGAAVLVDFKSIPYQDIDVLEWRRRLRVVEKFYSTQDCASLEQILLQESITHVIFPMDIPPPDCEILGTIYQDLAYRLVQYAP